MIDLGSRQQTYIGNNRCLDDIGTGRKVTAAAIGKEKVDSSFVIKPVKTSSHVKRIEDVKLPKGSVAVGEIHLGSKVIVEEPDEVVQYIEKEVPYEEIVYRPKIRQEFVEKQVPVYVDEEVLEDVEVEEIVYEDVIVEEVVDKFIDVEKKIPKVVERKIPVTLSIPKVVKKEVEKIIEVPNGEVVHKEVKVVKEKVNYRRRFVEKPVPIVVEHEVNAVVRHDTSTVKEVEVVDHFPVITPVDVHIAKPVNVNVRAHGQGQVTHRVVTIPAAHYNTLLKKLNPSLHDDLPLFMEDGVIPMLNQELSYLPPPIDAEIEGFNVFEAAFKGIEEKDFITDTSKSSHAKSKSSTSSSSLSTSTSSTTSSSTSSTTSSDTTSEPKEDSSVYESSYVYSYQSQKTLPTQLSTISQDVLETKDVKPRKKCIVC